MTTGPLLWIAVGFAAALVLFFMFAFFKGVTTSGQDQVLRFLAAMCAGFAASLFTGNAVFAMDSEMAVGLKWSLTSSAGFALFAVVWFFWRGVIPLPPDAFNMTIPAGWTFDGAVRAIVANDNAVVQYNNLNAAQLQTVLNGGPLHCQTPKEALEHLRGMAPPDALPSYSVVFKRPTYTIHA